MKRTIVILILASVIMIAKGQSYNSITVTDMNNLTKDQLQFSLEKVNKNIKTGKIMTGVGVGGALIGGIIYGAGMNSMVNGSVDGYAPAMGGSFILWGGILTASVGIPIWIVNENKKADIEIAMVKYATGSGVGLKLRF